MSSGEGKEKTLDEYISEMPPRENNAGLLLAWHHDAVALFVMKANNVNQKAEIVKPPWLHLTDGRTNLDSFMRDLVEELKSAGGGQSYKTALVAPNTLAQFSRIVLDLANIQMHPYMQTVMKEVLRDHPAARHLATLVAIRDGKTGLEERLGPFPQFSSYINLFN